MRLVNSGNGEASWKQYDIMIFFLIEKQQLQKIGLRQGLLLLITVLNYFLNNKKNTKDIIDKVQKELQIILLFLVS